MDSEILQQKKTRKGRENNKLQDIREEGSVECIWNHSREAKHLRDLLKHYFNHLGAWAGQENRILDGSIPEATSWHLSVLSRTTQFL